MVHLAKLLAAILVVTICTPVFAQDVLRSTGTSARSYNYLEGQYLTNVDTDTPLVLTLLVDLAGSLSLVAKYIKVTASVAEQGIEVSGSAVSKSIGIVYHQSLEALDQTDWVVEFSAGKQEVTLSIPGQSVSDTGSFQEVYLGLRRTLTDGIEGELGARRWKADGDAEVTGEAKLVYRYAESLDIAFGLREITESNIIGIGLRYTW